MTTLTARLVAEIERREGIAREATPGPWHWTPPSEKQYPEADESLIGADDEPVLVGWGYDAYGIDARDEDRAFIASNGPECVLGYFAALRRIVEIHRVEQFGETLRSFQGHAFTRTWDECAICGEVERGYCNTVAAVAEALDVSP